MREHREHKGERDRDRTTFAIVWPITSMTSIGKPDMTASFDRRLQGYLLALKERESTVSTDTARGTTKRRRSSLAFNRCLNSVFTVLRTASSKHFCRSN
jgi:hypothetical protein